ncbi:uncharacterized protein LOC117316936 [Pecten maximus]|uniref:uncharacterized protein LOC117316936 n=1 Tax=Pecten maximus TaxID=6579 RepID=UPI0014582D6E|nr:uncharacterized protein LOC117316936 [Pecten maximus]
MSNQTIQKGYDSISLNQKLEATKISRMIRNRQPKTAWGRPTGANVKTVTRCQQLQNASAAEILQIQHIRGEIPDLKCITQHPGFAPVCLNVFVLRTAYHAFRQHHNGNIPESPA